MKYYVDTSAMYALVDRGEANHERARDWLVDTVARDASAWFITCQPAVVETISLVQRRLGMRAVRDFIARVLPRVFVEHLDQLAMQRVMVALVSTDSRSISFVDQAGFDAALIGRCHTVFAFDRHFSRTGLPVVPAVVQPPATPAAP